MKASRRYAPDKITLCRKGLQKFILVVNNGLSKYVLSGMNQTIRIIIIGEQKKHVSQIR